MEEQGRFEGYIKDGKKFGRGKFFYHDGMYYDGLWFNNKKNGLGSTYYPDNELCYHGLWKDDQFDGEGEITNNSCNVIDEKFDYRDLSEVF